MWRMQVRKSWSLKHLTRLEAFPSNRPDGRPLAMELQFGGTTFSNEGQAGLRGAHSLRAHGPHGHSLPLCQVRLPHCQNGTAAAWRRVTQCCQPLTAVSFKSFLSHVRGLGL